MQTIKLTNLVNNYLPVFFSANETLMTIGLPGLGKTQVIRAKCRTLLREYNLGLKGKEAEVESTQYTPEAAKEEGFFLIDLSAIPKESLAIPFIDPYAAKKHDGDSRDVQHLHRDVIYELKALQRFLRDNPEKKAVLMVDEISSANQDDQRTLMNVFEGGLLPDGTHFPIERTFVVIAGNPPSDFPGYEDYTGATYPIEEAVLSRAAVFFVETDVNSFIEYGESANEKGEYNLHPRIVAALKNDPRLFMPKTQDETDVRVSNARTFKKLSNVLYACDKQGVRWSRDVLAAYLGDKVGDSLAATLTALDRLVSLEALFGTDKTKTLNKAALEKFSKLSQFEQYYLILMATDAQSPLDFKKANTVAKFEQLIDSPGTHKEIYFSLARKLARINKGEDANSKLAYAFAELKKQVRKAQKAMAAGETDVVLEPTLIDKLLSWQTNVRQLQS